MVMNKPGASLNARFGPERKAWVRKLDAIVTLMAPAGIIGVLFVASIKIEIPLLKGAFYGALACTPIVAYTLYRETNLSRIERIAILSLVLCLSIALMVATLESRPLS